MEVVYILQIITIAVSIVSVVSSVIVSVKTNKTQNIAKIVANQRLIFLQQYREKSSLLLTLCSPEIISGAQDGSFERELLQTSYELKSIFKACYKQESELLRLIDTVVENAFLFKKTNSAEDKDRLNEAIKQLFRLINIYDVAYWRFIIDQTSGKNYKIDNFDSYFYEAEKTFDSGASDK